MPCANCKGMVNLTPSMWLRYFRNKKLPFCAVNGCRKYKKYLSADPVIKENEDEFFSGYDNKRESEPAQNHVRTIGRDALQEGEVSKGNP